MLRLIPLICTIGMVSSCQTTNGGVMAQSMTPAISMPAASEIAGDMAGRLAEQIGSASSTTIKMNPDTSDYAIALKAALRGWGYTITSSQKIEKSVKPIDLAYSIDHIDGHLLARLSTPSVALGRAYNVTETGAAPTSPLSIIRRD